MQFGHSNSVESELAGLALQPPAQRREVGGWPKLVGPDMPAQYNDAMALPTAVYSAEQVRALDQRAIESSGVSGYILMKRAGEAALRYLRARWPMAHRIVIVCGGGNNGGDGYVLARFAQAAGLEVSVIAAAPVAGLKGDARLAHADLSPAAGVPRRSALPCCARAR